jgi:hypothetical protein
VGKWCRQNQPGLGLSKTSALGVFWQQIMRSWGMIRRLSDNPFRAAQAALVNAHRVVTTHLEDLPRQVGGCAWAARLGAAVLCAQGLPGEWVVGTFKRARWQSDHCWVECQGWILDWTVRQFKVNSDWLITPTEDPRYQYLRHFQQDPQTRIAQRFPGLLPEAQRSRLENTFAQWPEHEKPFGLEFDRFLAQGLAVPPPQIEPRMPAATRYL